VTGGANAAETAITAPIGARQRLLLDTELAVSRGRPIMTP
jgi:hypothetical protein